MSNELARKIILKTAVVEHGLVSPLFIDVVIQMMKDYAEQSNSDTANVRQGDSSADVCEWEQDQDGVYFTKCDNAFFFDTGGIADNKGKYCFYCGKVIKEIKAKEQTA